MCVLETYFTDIHFFPSNSRKQQGGAADVFAVACTDGTFKIINRTGRVEHSIEAHRGAVTSVRWSYEGTALATAGEDGQVKVWSRNGMLRSTLAQADAPIYALAWSADSNQLLYCSGPNIVIKSLQSSAKEVAWRAHDGVALKVDWSPISGLIVSGGEDCRYKVWDGFGRLLFQSSTFKSSITSVAWSPTGQVFAVGSFNSLAICDRMGWVHCKVSTDTGSLLGISWTCDGTQLAAAGGTGAVCFGQLLDVGLEEGRVHVELCEERRVVVHDILGEVHEELEFRDRVVNMALGYGHLIVATSTQCHIYRTSNWNTPHIFDLKDTVTLIIPCERCFMMLDTFTGLQIFAYDGRQICNPKFQGQRTEFLNSQMVSVSNDTLAVLDHGNRAIVRMFDTAQGRPIGEPFTHGLPISEIALSQAGTAADRQLLFIDANRDLHLLRVMKREASKLAGMVDSAAWHDATPMLAAMVDQRLTIWQYPAAAVVDRDLLAATRYIKSDSDFGKQAQIQQFSGCKCVIRRSDGAQATAATSPYPAMLYDFVRANQWAKTTRLCRFVKDPSLWACLAAMSMEGRELATAEVAFAAIDAVDKLRFVLHVKALPTEESRLAELALYRRQPNEAESILLQAGLIYRAVKMNIKLFRWHRALELAIKHKQHQDTVLMYRQRHLRIMKQQETDETFLQLAQELRVDEAAIKQRIQEEKLKEAQRPGAKRYA